MNYNNSVWRTLALVTQLGIGMLTPVFLCVFIGWFLDGKFGWHTLIPLMVLGFVSGLRNAYVLVKNAIPERDSDDRKSDLEKEKSHDEED